MKKMCTSKKRYLNFPFSYIIILVCSGFVKKKSRQYLLPRQLQREAFSYFLRKDLQSVHWSTVGLVSWVPTRIRSREQ